MIEAPEPLYDCLHQVVTKIRAFLLQEVLFDLVVHSVGANEYGYYTAQAEESVLNSGATNDTFFILGR